MATDDPCDEVTDGQIGAYWDQRIGPDLRASGVPVDALKSMRSRYVSDVRANPEALRQLAEEVRDGR